MGPLRGRRWDDNIKTDPSRMGYGNRAQDRRIDFRNGFMLALL
jgi:hypothetical protein